MKCRNSSKPTLNHLTFSTMLPNLEIFLHLLKIYFCFNLKLKTQHAYVMANG